MTDSDFEHVSEDEAKRLWKRAAELQAEAAMKAEVRAETPSEDRPAEEESTDGYALEHVRAAALEAGIGSEYVSEALVELSTERALPAAGNGTLDKLASRFLGRPPDALEARRVIDAPVATVLAAMEKIFPGEPYNLTLKERTGDLAQGGVMVFDVQGAGFTTSGGWVGEMSWADLREVYCSVRSISESQCEVTLRSPTAWAHKLNMGIGGVITGLGAGAGFGVGSALGAGVAAAASALSLGIVGIVLVVLVLAGGVSGGGFLANRGYRALYAHALRKGVRALETLLGGVAVEAQGGWGIDPSLPQPGTPRALVAESDDP